MKVNQTVIDELSDAIVEGMKRLGDVKAEAQSQIRSVLETAFQNFDIVTREQMEVQEALLTKTRKQISDLEERIAFMQEGIRYCPDNPAAHNDLGLGLMLWGDLTAARTQFAYALRLEPDYNPALINLSRIQYNQQPGQKKGHRSERSGPAARDAGNAVHRGSRERLIRHYQNSEEHLERRKKWSDRQKKLIKQNGGFD